VSGKWSDLHLLENGNFLLSYYYPYGAYLSHYNHEMAIFDKDFQLIKAIHPEEGNIALATFDRTKIVTCNGEKILSANVSLPWIYMYNENLNPIDSLELKIPYAIINYSDTLLANSFETMKKGALKITNVQFINSGMALVSYFTSTSCTGEMLIEIKDNQLIAKSEKLIDAYQFWYFLFKGNYNYQLNASDIEWFKQNSSGIMYKNKLYHIHSGESTLPIGLTNQEASDLKNIPNLSGSIYFYFAISEFKTEPN
jgi:hypothetical protein